WEVMGFWPNFEMRDGQPATRDEKPDNPAMLVRIRGERRFVEGGVLPQEMVKGLGLILAPAEGGQVEFCFLRDGREEKRGYLRVGETIPTGWNDWTVTLEDFELQGVISERIEPVSKGEGRGSGAFSAHAFRARLVVPRGTGDVLEGEPVWVESGRITTLRAGEMRVRVGYGLKLQEVPFFMRLIKFEVPRFEGTDQPANFIATIEFRDKKNNQTRRDVAKMNHPANWPGGFFAVMTGWNYKFSQAEWNPRDLSETTLQVLYDPGWLLKWIGSLAICVGIVLLFYWKPRQSKAGGAERGDSGFKGELKRVGRAACEEKMIVSQRCREN
ncbi:MAG: cytochrome c biogenesis protein ResB, partial [Chthoniobacterales bacterium]|nr:cytochrome c biogenesis protein ResB [Chthoniobacterales bacterium]